VGVLSDPDAMAYVLSQIHQIKTLYPEKNVSFAVQGGFDQPLDGRYSKMEAYYIRHYGKYTRALVRRQVEPLNAAQSSIIDGITGKKKATSDPAETGWLKFVADYPVVLKADLPPAQTGK